MKIVKKYIIGKRLLNKLVINFIMEFKLEMELKFLDNLMEKFKN